MHEQAFNLFITQFRVDATLPNFIFRKMNKIVSGGLFYSKVKRHYDNLML